MGLCPDCENSECLTYATIAFTSSDASIGITPSVVDGVATYDFKVLASFALEIADSETATLSGNGTLATPLVAAVKLSTNPLSVLTTDSEGLLVLAPALVESPNTKTDSESIEITLSGTSFRNIQADLKLSSTSGNAASMQPDGLYVPPAPTVPVSRFGKLTEDVLATADRNFDLATFSFDLNKGADSFFSVDPTARIYKLGNTFAVDNGIHLLISDIGNLIEFNGYGANFMRINLSAASYEFGDNSAGSIRLGLLGGTNTAYINALTIQLGDYDLVGASSHDMFLKIDNPNQRITAEFEGEEYFVIDPSAAVGQYVLGDYSATGNSSYLDIGDTDSYIDLICGESGGANFSGFNIVPEQIDAYINNGTAVERYTLRENEFEVALTGGKQLTFNIVDGLILTGHAASILKTGTTWTDYAGAGAGTLANAPHAGDPDKWIAVDDNGTIRKIPTWI